MLLIILSLLIHIIIECYGITLIIICIYEKYNTSCYYDDDKYNNILRYNKVILLYVILLIWKYFISLYVTDQ